MRKNSRNSQDIIDMKDAVQVFFQILDALNIKIQDIQKHSRNWINLFSLQRAIQDIL